MTANAAMLIIGEEILSGRTKDANLPHLAGRLGEIGIPIREARVVPDDVPIIIETVRTLSARFTHVFTSGGIGPTHDDRTAEAVAAAFDTVLEQHPDAYEALRRQYPDDSWLNEARLKMAQIPVGASLIDNPVSGAPGFKIANVHVMAGVPRIFQAMLDAVVPTLEGGRPISQVSVLTRLMEGQVADALGKLQDAHPTVSVGSYPKYVMGGDGPSLALVARGPEASEVDAAAAALVDLAESFGDVPIVER